MKPRPLNQTGLTHLMAPILVMIIVGLLVGYTLFRTSHAHAPSLSRSAQPFGQQYQGWIIGAYTFDRFKTHGASSNLINTAFNNNRTYVFGNPASSIGVPLITFQSYRQMEAAFANHTLPGKYKAVMYDNEHWPMTPITEQQHPDMYEHMAANLVHAHGMLFISAPAPDIVRAIGVVIHNNTQDTYLERNLAGGAAKYADVVDIQAQYLEPKLSEFVSFATTAARQARQANPHVKVYIGIATGPDGQTVSAQQLYNAYKGVLPIADGYWLNVSGQNQYCPNCAAPRPDLAVTLLHNIYGSN